MPDGVAGLEAIGVVVPASDCAQFDGIRYVDGPVTAEAEFPGGHGLGIRRRVLHDAMRRRAVALGVELRWGSRVTGLAPDGLETDSGRVRGRVVVAADGRQSKLRRMAGLERVGRRRDRVGVRRHFAAKPWSRFVEVHWSDGSEAYVTPLGDNLVGVAVLGGRSGGRFDDRIGRFPELADRLAGADVASRDRGAGPFGQRSRRVVQDRMVLVGDAAGCLDPISGEGISIALHEASAAMRCAEEGRLERYQELHRRLRRVPVAMTRALTLAAARPAVRRRMMRALSRSDSLFADLLAIGSRARRPAVIGPHGAIALALELGRRGV